MDELNNNDRNPFDEQGSSNSGYNTSGAYDQPRQDTGYDPYNQPRQSTDPYGQSQQNANPYGQTPPNVNPYSQQTQNANPYDQPYQQQYDQQSGTYNQRNIPQQGYVPPQYGMPYQPYAQNQSTGMAVASLVLGIISICLSLFMFSFPVLFLAPIIGLILGIVFKTKHLPVGKGLSTAGIVTSAIGLILPIILVIIMAVILLSYGDTLMDYIRTQSPEEYEYFYEMYGDQFPQWFDGMFRFFGIK